MEPEPQEVNGTFNLEFEIVDDSSKRGRPKLVDNRGYSYNIQRRRGEKKKKDYRAVIREIIKNIPGQPSVKKVTVDFERAIWSAFQKVLPEVRIMGCAFHWSQALWRKVSVRKVLFIICLILYFESLYNKSYLYCWLFQVQELGLQQAYRNDRGTHDLVRKLLALPFLPADEIPNAFHRLEAKATTEPLQALAQYINNTWISSTTWHPSCWSVFQQSVRTNNDTEGWHHGLNRRAQGKSQLPFYLLVELLFQEAKLTSLQIRLVSDKKLKRIQRKEYRNVQARLFEAWDKYQNGDISVERLLKTASHLVASQI